MQKRNKQVKKNTKLNYDKEFYTRPIKAIIYLNMNGVFSFGGTISPKKEASSAILSKTLRTISPKYMPEIIFSKICQLVKKKFKIN